MNPPYDAIAEYLEKLGWKLTNASIDREMEPIYTFGSSHAVSHVQGRISATFHCEWIGPTQDLLDEKTIERAKKETLEWIKNG